MLMKKYLMIGLLCLLSSEFVWGQHFPQIDPHKFTSDTTLFTPRKPWRAAVEVFGMNIGVWGFDRFLMNADFARINGHTIKSNFKTGPVWDTDKFSTNLVAHPYHGSLYFNAARSNGMNFWQSMPFALGGSLMWEFFMEIEPPSINDLLATTFGGIELGEITYRLSDLFIDNRTHGAERVGREILAGLISPMRAINRLVTGEAWKRNTSKGRAFSSVPVNFTASIGPRFLAEQEGSKHGTTSMHVGLRLDYGDPFNDDFYSPYEWFQLKAGFDVFSAQPLVSQVNAIGAIWGKQIWEKGASSLAAGIFQHFDYYDSELRSDSEQEIAPYRISEAAAVGGGLIYYKKGTPDNKVDVYAELYGTGVALGASVSDYLKLEERDYNLGSGYSVKAFTGMSYDKRWAFLLDFENYHIFTWKGYEPGVDWDTVDFTSLNVQGDAGNARLTVFSTTLVYLFKERWNVSLKNRYFSRRTKYKYYDTVDSSTYDIMLSLGIHI